MLKRRIIPTLLLKGGRMVKGRQFANYRDTGDPVSASRIYSAQKADELVFIDIEASGQNRTALLSLIGKVSEECFMPFTVGGGIRSIEDIRELLRAGADKVLINTGAAEVPGLVEQAADSFGRQCIVVGIDLRLGVEGYRIYTHCGRQLSDTRLEEYIPRMERAGAGEFLINSIDRDGMMQGYDLDLLRRVKAHTARPVIALGGAGHFQHLAEVLQADLAHAVACASLFHFGDNNPIRARSFLKNKGIPVKNV